VTEWTISIGD